MNYSTTLRVNGSEISATSPTYFIADIAANHDGDLVRAKELIWLAKESGADCAKFQHFISEKIVSNRGFTGELAAVSHQRDWKRSVVDIYDQYHTRREWSDDLYNECKRAEIDFMTTPYDAEAIDLLDHLLPAYKIGSGDITFLDILEKIACRNKAVFLATGASNIDEVIDAASIILKHNPNLCLLQCNTNYTGDQENFNFVNLNVLKQFATIWPSMVLGLSDHTPGHSAVIGAVTLGARVIEKHFTDDNDRIGPDHKFALNPNSWRDMVNATRELEKALGDGVKRVEENEQETVVIQRRALRLTRSLPAGTKLREDDLEALRPCPKNAISPMFLNDVIGKTLIKKIEKGEHLEWNNLASS